MTPEELAEIQARHRLDGAKFSEVALTNPRYQDWTFRAWKDRAELLTALTELRAELAAALEHNNTMQRQDQRHMEGMEAKITELRAENAERSYAEGMSKAADRLRAENADLKVELAAVKSYDIKHRFDCMSLDTRTQIPSCTCGLAELLGDKE